MKKIWINGCFDILHRGHIEMFKFAKTKGSFLTVGIDSDKRIKELKGENRPFNSQEDRKYFLESIKFIDHCEIFNTEEELEQKINSFSPDVMIVGSDYKDKRVVGSEYAKELLFFDRIKGYSTTKILEKK
tara:strand:- start:728 stop:1117 length:390 start_codon:yes stop_codon:yes gene_type:complete